jgi:hypothetical protein
MEVVMKTVRRLERWLVVTLLSIALLPVATAASAARARVVHRGHRTRVVVHRGFPVRRTLPRVVVRSPGVAVRVTPRVFLPPVVFGATVVKVRPEPKRVVWHETATVERDDDWVELTLNADHRGDRLFLDVADGAARISFAEVVFDNGEAQVVDFNEKRYGTGYYSLIDFKDGRKVDHVRIVARAESPRTSIGVDLVS